MSKRDVGELPPAEKLHAYFKGHIELSPAEGMKLVRRLRQRGEGRTEAERACRAVALTCDAIGHPRTGVRGYWISRDAWDLASRVHENTLPDATPTPRSPEGRDLPSDWALETVADAIGQMGCGDRDVAPADAQEAWNEVHNWLFARLSGPDEEDTNE
jgi:hypothetical protein